MIRGPGIHISCVIIGAGHAGLAIRSGPERVEETLAFLAETWERFLPGRPFEYRFLDDWIDTMYRQEERISRVMTDFSALAILLACMGLFGLVWFTVENRQKEIGIRKTLGAGVWDIVHRLSREFSYVVIVANVIAWPIGFYLLREWLNRFAYRIDPALVHFVVAGGLALLVAMATVGYHALRAARANPVDVLRNE